MKKNETKGAKSAKVNESKSVKRNATKQVTNIVSVKAVESANVHAESDTTTALPVVTEAETKSGKVSSKDVMKAAGNIRAAIKEERRGANVTIRLIAERAAAGDSDAVNILCALCDVPRTALYSLNINIVRTAVNAYYPYYIESEGRKISVKPVGVWYSTKMDGESIEDASKRVKRGQRAVAVVDYLDMLIKAAKSRAKGVKPRCVNANAIYSDIAMSETAESITAKDIDDAKARKSYLSGAANVWHKHSLLGFYI